jgi:hypothetical protein
MLKCMGKDYATICTDLPPADRTTLRHSYIPPKTWNDREAQQRQNAPGTLVPRTERRGIAIAAYTLSELHKQWDPPSILFAVGRLAATAKVTAWYDLGKPDREWLEAAIPSQPIARQLARRRPPGHQLVRQAITDLQKAYEPAAKITQAVAKNNLETAQQLKRKQGIRLGGIALLLACVPFADYIANQGRNIRPAEIDGMVQEQRWTIDLMINHISPAGDIPIELPTMAALGDPNSHLSQHWAQYTRGLPAYDAYARALANVPLQRW